MGEKEEKGWAEQFGLETFKGDDTVKGREIEDFTRGKWKDLKQNEDDKGTSESGIDKETTDELQATRRPE